MLMHIGDPARPAGDAIAIRRGLLNEPRHGVAEFFWDAAGVKVFARCGGAKCAAASSVAGMLVV